ncbi:type IV pilus modification PilV family protein [Maridesulfovibrio bastinii]|uniref:type IV pilus modification PilV family protein n=1 Tax=Maridesulfovibrio bastinii TaxID=47157 RepID=UPI0004194098|nr:type II secretion system protein [Maridesulfovibrio bastinii]
MSSDSKKNGFTFLEVMAAIVIIAVMGLSSVQLMKNTDDEFINVKATRIAYELAQQKLYEIVEDHSLRLYSGNDGSFDDEQYGKYTWNSKMLSTSIDHVRILEVEVVNEEVNVRGVMDYMVYIK